MISILLFISGPEIFIIFIFILLLFGSKKIPEFARGLGKGMQEFRRATDDIKKEFNEQTSEIREEIDDVKKGLDDNTSEIKKDVDKVKKNIDKETGKVRKDIDDLNENLKG